MTKSQQVIRFSKETKVIIIFDMWLTVHRNSVWITNQLDVTFV